MKHLRELKISIDFALEREIHFKLGQNLGKTCQEPAVSCLLQEQNNYILQNLQNALLVLFQSSQTSSAVWTNKSVLVSGLDKIRKSFHLCHPRWLFVLDSHYKKQQEIFPSSAILLPYFGLFQMKWIVLHEMFISFP